MSFVFFTSAAVRMLPPQLPCELAAVEGRRRG